MSTYSNKLKSPHWQKMRLKVMQRDKFTCKLCKDTETTLNVHHKYYEQGKEPWEYPMNALVTLCEHCHKEVSDKDINDIPFEYIKIYKSDGWTTGKRIMFVAALDRAFMIIYDKDGNRICGFNMSGNEGKSIKSWFKNATKGL